ncbi:helix-turn-helix domain-containing protein [Streptomyces sp. NPDC058240]|uniref:helix-turn-helix domain-containing protein n=1 Tax=Streptomyces sp. NPDC058240 TaxID=3346396 RepID=UPI0036EB73BA
MADQLGTLLRRLRNRSGLTQEHLEARSGVSVRTIRRLENGRSGDHRLGTVNLLADALEAGPEDRQRLAATLAKSKAEPAGEPAPVPESAPVPQSAPAPVPVPAQNSAQNCGQNPGQNPGPPPPPHPFTANLSPPPPNWPGKSGAAGSARRNTAGCTTLFRFRCAGRTLPNR